MPSAAARLGPQGQLLKNPVSDNVGGAKFFLGRLEMARHITFADKVRIRSTSVTEALGIAGRTGIVHGWTTPSVTGVEVIGNSEDDYAIAVDVEGQSARLWFAEDYLEFVDHQPGTTRSVGGRLLMRDAQGDWHEVKLQ